MRAREFVMKDAYSFHADYADLEREYRSMYDTYTRIFTRLGLRFRAVAADTGAIGGTGSHEFHVLADSGEDAIAFCTESRLRRQRRAGRGAGAGGGARRAAPSRCSRGADARQDALRRRGRAAQAAARAHRQDDRGDGRKTSLVLAAAARRSPAERAQGAEAAGRARSASRMRTRAASRASAARPATSARWACQRRCASSRTAAVAAMRDFVCGANEADLHLAGVNWGRDLPEPAPSPTCATSSTATQPGRQGHACASRAASRSATSSSSGTKYSEAMNATVLDEQGRQVAADGHGLLRHRRDAHRRGGDRAEPRRARHRLAGAACAVRRSCLVRLNWDKSDAGARGRRSTVRRTAARPASTCCSTTATSGPGVKFADMPN